MKKTIKLILVLLWMGLIYFFSSQNAGESSSLSNSFISTIYEFFTHKEITLDILENCSFFVRKLAHFSIYFVLGVLVLNFMFEFNNKYQGYISLGICMLYSIMDEMHQGFVDGRSGQLTDSLIDTVGAFVGICVFFLIRKYYLIHKDKKEKVR